MKNTLLVLSVLFSLVAVPSSMYITHSILVSIHADRLLFFLFWMNMPFIFIAHLISGIITKLAK